ncbi:hypothetical protein DUNSADRAFT_9903 [Dunaliella salina]|uniref:Uncharacterized protein n=1 Tax=Dunaliella salina TaxID=3046 RepID=A0ABQ7H582_DUNSA|nr:hypothetical protein DUNSADRAFT_9903 [Dunaliella salina]|eukprot:KAF5842022.1 hypothetical protein DUNSADRAFT_9903 [Dunaliella salina]
MLIDSRCDQDHENHPIADNDFTFNLMRNDDSKSGDQSSGIPLTPVVFSTVNKPGNSNKGLNSGSPSSKQRFEQWLAATEATFFSPKPLAAFAQPTPGPFHKPATQPSQDADLGTEVACSSPAHPKHNQPIPAPSTVAWYVRTPAPKTQAAPDSSDEDVNEEEDEGDDHSGKGKEESECVQDTASERSPSLAPAGTPSTTEGSMSPYSDMAVSNCMKSLSRLRCSAGEEEGMQISPAPHPYQQQQQHHQPDTPLMINFDSALNPSLTPLQLHFGQQDGDQQQQQQQQQQPCTPQNGDNVLEAEAFQVLTPINEVIGLMASPTPMQEMDD